MKLEIVPFEKQLLESTKSVLEEAIKSDYETVIIFGFKGGQVQTTMSEAKSTLSLVGALEAAKCLVLHEGRYGEV